MMFLTCSKEEFVNSLIESHSLIDSDTFDMYKYALFYCKMDVKILAECFTLYREYVA